MTRVTIFTGVLACLGAGAMSLALADPPAPSAPAAATPAPAAEAPKTDPAAKPAASEMDPLEKHFRAEGYQVRMKDGEKLFCKREEVLGSRLSAGMKCATVEALKAREDQDQQSAERAQRAARTGTLPGGN